MMNLRRSLLCLSILAAAGCAVDGGDAPDTTAPEEASEAATDADDDVESAEAQDASADDDGSPVLADLSTIGVQRIPSNIETQRFVSQAEAGGLPANSLRAGVVYEWTSGVFRAFDLLSGQQEQAQPGGPLWRDAGFVLEITEDTIITVSDVDAGDGRLGLGWTVSNLPAREGGFDADGQEPLPEYQLVTTDLLGTPLVVSDPFEADPRAYGSCQVGDTTEFVTVGPVAFSWATGALFEFPSDDVTASLVGTGLEFRQVGCTLRPTGSVVSASALAEDNYTHNLIVVVSSPDSSTSVERHLRYVSGLNRRDDMVAMGDDLVLVQIEIDRWIVVNPMTGTQIDAPPLLDIVGLSFDRRSVQGWDSAFRSGDGLVMVTAWGSILELSLVDGSMRVTEADGAFDVETDVPSRPSPFGIVETSRGSLMLASVFGNESYPYTVGVDLETKQQTFKYGGASPVVLDEGVLVVRDRDFGVVALDLEERSELWTLDSMPLVAFDTVIVRTDEGFLLYGSN